jgi:hypothetical protein
MHEAWKEWQETILDLLEAQTLSEFVSRSAPLKVDVRRPA